MKTLPITVLLSLMALPGRAAPVDLGQVKLQDGRQLEQAKVVKVEPDGLRMEHRHGVGKIRFEDLPADLARRFSLDEATASAWRMEQKERLDREADAQRRSRVQALMEESRAAQETQARRQRMAIFDQAGTTGFNYADLDEQLLKHIALWKEAGRDDLAARFEEDRNVLKQQEIARPAAALEAEKQALARRVESLQSEVNTANSRPTTTTVVIDSDRSSGYGYHSYYNTPHYIVPPPVVIKPPVPCPPVRVPAPGRPIFTKPTDPASPPGVHPGPGYPTRLPGRPPLLPQPEPRPRPVPFQKG